jgi:hypothetical protein
MGNFNAYKFYKIIKHFEVNTLGRSVASVGLGESLQKFGYQIHIATANSPTTSIQTVNECEVKTRIKIWLNRFFFVIPFYLEFVLLQSANCVNNVYNGTYKSAQ